MENVITLEELQNYINVVIPNLEKKLSSKRTSELKKLEFYQIYCEVLRLIGPYDFISFNKYLELDEDHTNTDKAFYYQRKDHMSVIFEALNDMEIYDKYDLLLISTPPRTGKTTSGIRFLSWICGRYPENTQLAISYSDSVTSSFYLGVTEVVESDRYKEVFPDAPLVNQNAKREEIWLKTMKRYPTISFVPIGGSMTGRAEAGNYLYLDDLVSGLEEALSITRLEKLWGFYTVNAKQRKKDNAKEIHIATRWSVHDPITKLARDNAKNPRCKIISLPCYLTDKEEDVSAFNFPGGFSTEYYKDLESTMDKASFGALYKTEPIEREGLLYHEEDLQYYFELPKERQDTIIAVCDSKNLGKDYVASIIGYCYNDLVYVEDVVFNPGLPEITRPLVANKWLEHKVVRADVEMNNGGNYYAEDLNKLIKAGNGDTSIRTFFSGNNKNVKIITYSDFAKKHFVFKHKSCYSKNSEYAEFMKNLLTWTQTGNNKHDDAPDCLAMMAQLVQEMSGKSVKIVDRRSLGL